MKSSKRCDRATTFYPTEVTSEFLKQPAMPLLVVEKDINRPAVYHYAHLLRFCALFSFGIAGSDCPLGPVQSQQHQQCNA
jgi:hypothetical protein